MEVNYIKWGDDFWKCICPVTHYELGYSSSIGFITHNTSGVVLSKPIKCITQSIIDYNKQ